MGQHCQSEICDVSLALYHFHRHLHNFRTAITVISTIAADHERVGYTARVLE